MITPLDETKISSRFNKAANTYDKAAVLQRLVGNTLLERLQGIRCQPHTILDLGCGTGHFATLLKKAYPAANIVGLDKSDKMLAQGQQKEKRNESPIVHWLCACSEALPFKNDTFELVYSNLMLHWSTNLTQSLNELRRVLKPGGLLLFSIVGPDTLQELRYCWAQVDDKPHVHVAEDMHDIGDNLMRTSFVDPVMDVDYFTLLYSAVLVLMKELKDLGAQNLAIDRHRGLTSKKSLQKLVQTYENFRNPEGKLPATWEIIYGHAWAPHETTEKNTHYNEIKIPINHIGGRTLE